LRQLTRPQQHMDYTEVQPISYPMPVNTEPVYSPATMIMFFVLGLAVYIFAAYCLSVIAKKTNTPRPWLAWIPIANFVLMLQIAKLSLWWIVGILVPYVNILVLAYVWWKVAEVRRRPGWWGILMLITPVNLILMWFLAFREAPASSGPTAAPTPPAATPPQAA
jgi:hypothetical protein